MRLVGVLLSVTLLGSPVFAEDAKPAEAAPAAAKVKVPLRVVRVLPETSQALLFDKTKGSHVLVEVGQAVEGYTVDEIDGDEVTLLSENGAMVVLAAPDQSWRRRVNGDGAAPATAAGSGKPAKKADPAPQDPYGEEPAVRTAEAPGADVSGALPADPTIRSVAAPGGTASTVTSTSPSPSGSAIPAFVPLGGPAPSSAAATTTAPTPAPAPAAAPAPAPAAAPAPAPVPAPTAAAAKPDGADALAAALTGDPSPAPATAGATASGTATAAGPATATSSATQFTLPRASVNAALGDFAGTAASFHATFTPAGLHLDSISATSLLSKAGLRANDTILAVDNQPLRSIDDAANLYARASSARALTVQITRDSKPLTLHIAIQ